MERDMASTPGDNGREPWSELKVADLLSALAFGASFEDLANFLIEDLSYVEVELAPQDRAE